MARITKAKMKFMPRSISGLKYRADDSELGIALKGRPFFQVESDEIGARECVVDIT